VPRETGFSRVAADAPSAGQTPRGGRTPDGEFRAQGRAAGCIQKVLGLRNMDKNGLQRLSVNVSLLSN
ncbi:hypothetical protein, partial [Paracidovorax sp. MALMAid1276]|uniref:hypothetical protein n=1 Tax=Paracidovorax sp. MALMAid1276 TaxID=3411631 RepID=UPI003B9902C8